ncbi:response regulator [Paraburkholderia sabiae]|uniref:Response regulator transcription factor n=2 Tax=Paraburkholderia sabiae TaxID=273251 RepID=A0ABU9QL79_9BURK
MEKTVIHVLVVDEDREHCEMVRNFLQDNGLRVSVAHDMSRVGELHDALCPSIIVLDMMLRRLHGLAALGQLRATRDHVPVIMLNARDEANDRIAAFQLGADDCVGRPFFPQELVARIHAVIERAGPRVNAFPRSIVVPRRELVFGTFRLDLTARVLFLDGAPVRINEREFSLLEIFAHYPLQELSRARILVLMYGIGTPVLERSIDVPVWRLRQVLAADPSASHYIQTVRGIGYMFVPAVPASREHAP